MTTMTTTIVFLTLAALAGAMVPYNYYEFAVQNWVDGSYQIHGLWPAYSTGVYPVNCTNTPYQFIKPPLVNTMLTYWNAYPDENQQFWAHQWFAYGTCMQQQTGANQTKYFEKALSLFMTVLPENTTWTCGESVDCVIACFDLDYVRMSCRT